MEQLFTYILVHEVIITALKEQRLWAHNFQNNKKMKNGLPSLVSIVCMIFQAYAVLLHVSVLSHHHHHQHVPVSLFLFSDNRFPYNLIKDDLRSKTVSVFLSWLSFMLVIWLYQDRVMCFTLIFGGSGRTVTGCLLQAESGGSDLSR